MIASKALRVVGLGVVGVAALVLAACGAPASDEHELDVDDTDATSSALGSPDPGDGGEIGHAGDTDDQDGDEPTDRDCTDREREKHHGHHHHKFKVLDRLDGAKDKIITIASLPPGLSERLIAKLHELDSDRDGLVTRAEVKARKHRKRARR